MNEETNEQMTARHAREIAKHEENVAKWRDRYEKEWYNEKCVILGKHEEERQKSKFVSRTDENVITLQQGVLKNIIIDKVTVLMLFQGNYDVTCEKTPKMLSDCEGVRAIEGSISEFEKLFSFLPVPLPNLEEIVITDSNKHDAENSVKSFLLFVRVKAEMIPCVKKFSAKDPIMHGLFAKYLDTASPQTK